MKVGKRLMIQCNSCKQKHSIWIDGDDYYDGTKKYEFECPTTGSHSWFTGVVAADMEVDQQDEDVKAKELST
jgi:hypothetical protein